MNRCTLCGGAGGFNFSADPCDPDPRLCSECPACEGTGEAPADLHTTAELPAFETMRDVVERKLS